MKKSTLFISVLTLIIGSFFVSVNYSMASSFSQDIVLSPGWNIVSTPRVLENHSFSAEEISDNFDIFVLDASQISGWATMADLNQSEFEPLFGYFINNKTGSEQTLTLNYKDNLSPNEKLFGRNFTETGWYSIGSANPTYTKEQCSDTVDADNVESILNSLSGKHSFVVDFTDNIFPTNPNSVAVGDSWKAVTPSDLNDLNDLRELKGYAILINDIEALYSGFQNENAPTECQAIVTASQNDAEPDVFNSIAGENSVKIASFVINVDSSSTEAVLINSLTFDKDSNADIDLENLELKLDGVSQDVISIIGDEEIGLEFILADSLLVNPGNEIELDLYVDILDTTIESQTYESVIDLVDWSISGFISDSAILLLGDVDGQNLFVSEGASLTLGLAGSPITTSYIKGEQGVEVLGATFGSSPASDVTVKKVTLTGVSGTANGSLSTTNTGSLINSIMLYDGDTGALIPATVVSNNLSLDGKIIFDNLNWTIPAGATKRLLVKANLSTNTPGPNAVFAFDIDTAADVVALDTSNQTVSILGNNFNGATTATVAITIDAAGTLSLSAAPGTPISKGLYWGQAGVETSRFRFTSSNEAFHIEKLTVGPTGGEETDASNNVKSITLEYTNQAGSTVTVTQSVSSAASVNFGFSGANRPYVPKDSSVDVIVKANMKTNAEGATSTAAGDSTSPVFSLDYHASFNGSTTNGFRAIGAGSGSVLNGGSSGVSTDTAANNMYVYRVFPKVTQVALSTGEPLGTKDVFKFTVEAMGLSDSKLFFDNASTGSGSIVFDSVSQATATSSANTLTLYDDADGSTIDSLSFTAQDSSADEGHASVSFDFTTKDIEIEGGQSKTFRVEAQFTGFTTQSDFFQLILRDEAGVVNWVDNSTGSTANPDVANVAGVLRQLPINGPTFSKL